MKKKKMVWVVFATLFLLICTTFFLHRATEDPLLAKRIDDLASKGVTEISLTSLTDFEWNKAMVYGPYTSKEIIEGSLNSKFKGSTQGIEYRDDIFLLVFAKDHYVVKTVKLSRRGVDFSKNDQLLTTADDILKIH
ncbi:hypothetical protein CSV63_12190 [Sporosarcina sp. P34]|uniref:hypothetical protein n=1 Tax=Sporosarcina sp. P34 TaxID=2048247 RepID=UPI000C16BF1B|nr:hypothetical protein [Sporosarcina sp. P34]PID14527.1 hypothetical protein CSV63_12190 [Sporosarcina sp. P34]